MSALFAGVWVFVTGFVIGALLFSAILFGEHILSGFQNRERITRSVA